MFCFFIFWDCRIIKLLGESYNNDSNYIKNGRNYINIPTCISIIVVISIYYYKNPWQSPSEDDLRDSFTSGLIAFHLLLTGTAYLWNKIFYKFFHKVFNLNNSPQSTQRMQKVIDPEASYKTTLSSWGSRTEG